jgi:hypothetical protein
MPPSPAQTRQPLWWAAAALIAASLMAMGWMGWPGLHWDSAYFTTPILNVANGRGWQVTPYHFSAGDGAALLEPALPYQGHGVLNILLFGQTLSVRTYDTLLRWYGVLHVLTFLSYAWLSRLLLRRRHARATGTLSLLVGLMAALVALSVQGRPEQLIPLVLAAPLACLIQGASRRLCLIVSAAATGVIFTASPLPGLMSGAIFVLALAVHEPDGDRQHWLRVGSFALIAMAVSAAIVELLSPFGFGEWLHQIGARREVTMDMMPYLLRLRSAKGFTSYSPLWNVLALGLAGLISLTLARKRRWSSLAAAWLMFAYILPKGNDYSYVVFFPALFLMIYAARDQLLPACIAPLGRGPRRLCAGLAVLTLALYALGYLRSLERGLAYARDGMALTQARQQVARRIRAEEPSAEVTIGYPTYSNPSFVAFSQPGLLRLIGTTAPSLQPSAEEHPLETAIRKNGVQIGYYLLPQPSSAPGSQPPAQIFFGKLSFSLLDSHQHQEATNPASRLVTRVIWPYSQGYHYALYKRR